MSRKLHPILGTALAALGSLFIEPMTALAAPAPYSLAVASALLASEPARVGSAHHAAVAPSVRLVARGKLAAACQDADRRYRALQVEGSRLFFGPDRRKAELTAIEHYLDRHVRAKAPALEIIDEGFAPGPAWRSVAAAACVQSDQAAVAVRMLAAIASHAPASPAAGRFAVAMAAQARDWRQGPPAAPGNQTLPVVLLRALAEPTAAAVELAKTGRLAETDADRAAIAAVRRHLGLAP